MDLVIMMNGLWVCDWGIGFRVRRIGLGIGISDCNWGLGSGIEIEDCNWELVNSNLGDTN